MRRRFRVVTLLLFFAALSTGCGGEGGVAEKDRRHPVRVTVLLDGTNNSLRVGMSASVSIVVNRVVQVLTVPTSAVHTTTTGSTVDVLVDGKSQPRAVTVGASDAMRTQILSGINPGDQAVVALLERADLHRADGC